MAVDCFDVRFELDFQYVAECPHGSRHHRFAVDPREILRPGGVIALGECVRPFAGQILYPEFVFDFLTNFREVVTSQGLFSRYESYYNMGVIYLRQKKNLDAEAVFMKVVDENPGFYKAYNKLGILDGIKGDWVGAATYFKRALEILSRDFSATQADGAEIYCNYGEALFRGKLYPQARNALMQVLKIAPESIWGQKAKGLLAQLGGT